MLLYSTKKISPDVDLKEAVLKGLPPDNGLYMPYEMFHAPASFFENLPHMTYNEMAVELTKHIVGSYIPEAKIQEIISQAYDFDAPLIDLGEIKILELYQGPTLAFKDFGARFMGRLMGYFLEGSKQEVNILVATSGDTGSAVAHGFLNVEGIKVTILYPKGKVSDIQEKQFTTLGANITAIEIDGTFDDCQRLVKTAFLDRDLNEKLTLSSANSINIARLIPQSFYYVWAYKQLEDKSLPLYFSIPSGNFGNLTACLFAQAMGLPVSKIIAATNANDIVPQYLQNGNFVPRPSVSTISNAMDVGNPSNFARILDIYNNDWETIHTDIKGYSYSDTETSECIKKVHQEKNFTICPHTAVGYLAMEAFLKDKSEPSNAIVLATAHPVKFGNVVEPLIGEKIEIPQRLSKMLKGEKQSIPMSKNFDDFKEWLMNRM
ncbi:MAG: threonine synthase [Chitinophagales bacterium]|nr:threonine synthase [Chitinophagales bacterium]